MQEKVEAIKSMDWLINILIDIGISMILILITSIIIKLILKFTRKSINLNSKLTDRKKQTLSEVFASVIKYSIWFITLCIILSTFGVDISSLIAVAGVGSVAIGFGAKSVVQDIITGMFILFEDQFGVGDIITVENFTGTVESIGIRSTRIRGANGDLHIIPNGSITIITNMSKEFNRAVVDIGVAYEEDVDKVLKVMQDEAYKIFSNKAINGLIAEPNVLGIIELADSSVVIRILADTDIGENWFIEREIRRFMKNRLDKEKITIPYPQSVVHLSKE